MPTNRCTPALRSVIASGVQASGPQAETMGKPLFWTGPLRATSNLASLPQIGAFVEVFRRGSAKLAVLSQQGLQDSLQLGLGEKPEVGRNQAALAVEDDRIGEAPGAVAESAGEVDCFQSGHEHWVVDRHLGGRLAAFLRRIDGDPYNL